MKLPSLPAPLKNAFLDPNGDISLAEVAVCAAGFAVIGVPVLDHYWHAVAFDPLSYVGAVSGLVAAHAAARRIRGDLDSVAGPERR